MLELQIKLDAEKHTPENLRNNGKSAKLAKEIFELLQTHEPGHAAMAIAMVSAAMGEHVISAISIVASGIRIGALEISIKDNTTTH